MILLYIQYILFDKKGENPNKFYLYLGILVAIYSYCN